MSADTVIPLAEGAFLLPVADAGEARAWVDVLRRSGRFREVVQGLDSVAVSFDPTTTEAAAIKAYLEASLARGVPARDETQASELVIRVHYGGENGPDLDDVAMDAGLSRDEVVERHVAATYRVEMLGFIPGFAYLGGLDPALARARLAEPRRAVPAGSIGVAESFCGIYPVRGPGGWSVIGRTDKVLVDPHTEVPFMLRPGMTVRFEAA